MYMRIKVYFLMFGVRKRSSREAEVESPSSLVNVWNQQQGPRLQFHFFLAAEPRSFWKHFAKSKEQQQHQQSSPGAAGCDSG